jgi:peroxiredoxin
MPAMQRRWERYREHGLAIAAIAADRSDNKLVASFVNKLGLDYSILLDPERKVRNRHEVVGLPMSYLIGRDGKISGRVIDIAERDSPQAFNIKRVTPEDHCNKCIHQPQAFVRGVNDVSLSFIGVN